jgi:hypothetical protein
MTEATLKTAYAMTRIAAGTLPSIAVMSMAATTITLEQKTFDGRAPTL